MTLCTAGMRNDADGQPEGMICWRLRRLSRPSPTIPSVPSSAKLKVALPNRRTEPCGGNLALLAAGIDPPII